jgi:signal transduction histidine kinase
MLFSISNKTYRVLIAAFLLPFALLLSCSDDDNDKAPSTLISKSESMKAVAKACVETSAIGFGSCFKEMFKDEEAQIEFCRSFIDSVRFFADGSGYYFVEDMNAILVAHPFNKNIIGQSRIDVKDADGKLYVKDMIDLLKADGKGFVDYKFLNPITTKIEDEVAFVQKLDNCNMFIGSGYYVPTNNENIEILESNKNICKAIVQSAAKGFGGLIQKRNISESEQIPAFDKFIGPIRFFENKSGYFFLYKTDGTCMVHPTQPDIEGNNRLDHTDSKGKKYIKEMCDLVKESGSGFVEYYKVSFQTNKDDLKISYVEAIPGTDYFIGAGVYMN